MIPFAHVEFGHYPSMIRIVLAEDQAMVREKKKRKTGTT